MYICLYIKIWVEKTPMTINLYSHKTSSNTIPALNLNLAFNGVQIKIKVQAKLDELHQRKNN